MADHLEQGVLAGVKVLGATLQQLLSNEGAIGLRVPFWVKYACKAMLVKETFLDRLWLDAGVVDDIPKLVSILEDTENFNVRPFSALTIGRVLVLYFKKLPAPLLTLELHDHLRGAAQLEIFEDEKARIRFLCDLLRTLPAPNYYTLGKLLRVFAKVWNEQNKDTQRTTLEVWAPILILRENVHDMAMDLPWACHLLRILIENHETIYPRKALRSQDPTVAGRQTEVSERVGKAIKSTSSNTSLVPSTSTGNLNTSATGYSDAGSDARLSLNWLSVINAEKVKKMEVYLEKMNNLLKEFKECVQEPTEMLHCLELCVQKMTCMVDSLGMNPKALTRLIDTYHLDRCHVYVVDLHTALKKSRADDKYLRFFDTRALHGTLQRMYLSLQHELSLSFESVDTLMGGAIKNDPRNQAKFKKHTIQLFKQPEASEFWSNFFGSQSFAVSWDHFTKRLLSVTLRLNELYTSSSGKAAILEHLRHVLDDAQTNYVTVYKFAKFLDGFGDLDMAVHHCTSIVSKPWFHGYVSRREAARFLEPFAPSTFLIRFASLDPSSFAVNFKDDAHQLYSINVDVIHRPLPQTSQSTVTPPEGSSSTGSSPNTASPSSQTTSQTPTASTATMPAPTPTTQKSASSWANATPAARGSKPTSPAINSSTTSSGGSSSSNTAGSGKLKNLSAAKVDPEPPAPPRIRTSPIFVVMEGTEAREFTTMEEMIANFADFLQQTVLYKMLIQPWFYGEFTAKECQEYLQHEAVGTFLVRFSSHHAKLTLDYVSEDGTVIQHRLERTAEGKIANGNLLFEDIDHFVSETKGLRFAYKHDNQVSTTQEEETSRRSNTNFVTMLEDQESFVSDTLLSHLLTSNTKSSHDALGATPRSAPSGTQSAISSDAISPLSTSKIIVNGQTSTHLQMHQASIISLSSLKLMIENLEAKPIHPVSFTNTAPSATSNANTVSNYTGPLGSDLREVKKDQLESQLSHTLNKIATRSLISFEELARFTNLAFANDPATYQAVQNRIHKELTGASMLRKKGVSVKPQHLAMPRTLLHRLSQVEFKVKNQNKCDMKYTIEGPTAITQNAFFALSSSSGVLKAGESIKITVSVVLFKPCVLHEIIYVHCDDTTPQSNLGLMGNVVAASHTSGAVTETFAVPVSIAMDKSCMWAEVERFWSVPETFLAGIRSGNFQKKLGAGAAATVFLTSLYGVNVAVKVWDIGSRNMPPPDFDQELSIMSSISHPNLVRFIGAIPGRGMGALVMEFVSGGSLDKFLKFKTPDDEDMARAASESRNSAPSSVLIATADGKTPTEIVSIRNLNLSGDPNLTVTNTQLGTVQSFTVSAESSPTNSGSDHPIKSSSSGSGGLTSSSTTKTGALASKGAEMTLLNLAQMAAPSSSSVTAASNSLAPLSGTGNFLSRVPIALEIAKALLYLHERNLIHRDVKTLNVLINRESLSTRLSDFGEAATRDATLNEMVGSTPWMAPEVSMSQVYSSKADVFSFGLVLYELLVEAYPVRTMQMIAEGFIPRIPNNFCLDFPAYVRLIHACTLQNPDKRPTMFSVVRELEKIQQTTQIRKVRVVR